MAHENSKAGALVIVESPAKARTINRYLGPGYVVKASMGHVRDLPPRSFGIKVADGFRPTYQVLASRRSAVKELSKDARRAREVYLATDLDREGEAIAWHLVHALGLDEQKVRRAIFNEITAAAIRRAFAQPRGIDLHKVNAQQARRILDRIVGYELSPLLWRKIAKGLSAGRVQSVAVRLVVDREDRIRNFVPQESWRVIGYFTTAVDEADELAGQWRELLSEAGQGQSDRWAGRQSQWLFEHRSFRAELVSLNGQAFKPESVQAVRPVAEALGFVCERTEEKPWPEYADRGLKRIELVGRTDRQRAAAFRVRSVETRKTRTNPPPPFITATLEQVAANQLGFSSWRTMRIAQALYEGVDLGGTEGSVALITYMRTDSTNLSGESVEAARRFIEQRFGRQYLPGKPSRYGSSARAQEAHEAIRPTDVSRTPESLRGRLRADYLKLYELIWKRFVACQMSPARWEATTAMIESQTAIGLVSFKATGRRLLFDGFMKVAGLTSSAGEQVLPELQVDQPVAVLQIDPQQHFSSPPPRYSEASLIKALEAEGIGRPSTYATILQTIQDRGYVRQINRRFHPTDLGREVTERLVRYFPKIMDVKFTSHMEDQLDKIEEAHLDWVEVLNEFYEPFREALEQANAEMVASKSEPSEHACPKCGRLMVYRWSSKGRFLACSGYPKCTASYDVDEQGRPVVPQATEHRCERCGKPMILRRSRRGSFLGCSGYPDCSYTVACDEQGQPLKLVKEEEFRLPCEACGGELVVKRRGRRAFMGCSNYPQCKNTQPLPAGIRLERKAAPPPEPAGFNCDKCGQPMVVRVGRRGKFIACSGFPRCRNTRPIDQLEQLRNAAQQRQEADARTRPANDRGNGTEAGSPRGRAARASARKADKPVVRDLDSPTACPQCGGQMVLKLGRFGPFLSCGNYPQCKATARLEGQALQQAEQRLGAASARPAPEPTDIDCDQCGAKMVIRTGRTGRFLACSSYPKCKNTGPLPAGKTQTR